MVCLDLVHLLQVEFSKPLLGANGPAATLAGELPLAGELYLPISVTVREDTPSMK